MLQTTQIKTLQNEQRHLDAAQIEDPDLGPLGLLPGTWANVPDLAGHGWNIIALPFTGDDPGIDYRLFLSRCNETLTFKVVDKAVPNRGLNKASVPGINLDQLIVALDYEQTIVQIKADERPRSQRLPGDLSVIHHEAGLWLHMANETTAGLDIARLATVPHGDSVLALGTGRTYPGGPEIPDANTLPRGGATTRLDSYHAPYTHFHANPLADQLDPDRASEPLRRANRGLDFIQTTELRVDSRRGGGVLNIPFIEKHADAVSMESIYWLAEYRDPADSDATRLRLQYLQTVILEFFDRRDGRSGRIQWPHVSLNTMERATDVVQPLTPEEAATE